jgi:hypothetical protein
MHGQAVEENAGLRPHILWTNIPAFVHVYRCIVPMKEVCFPTATTGAAARGYARAIVYLHEATTISAKGSLCIVLFLRAPPSRTARDCLFMVQRTRLEE